MPKLLRQRSLGLFPMIGPRQLQQQRHWQREVNVRGRSLARQPKLSSPEQPIYATAFGRAFVSKGMDEFVLQVRLHELMPHSIRDQVNEVIEHFSGAAKELVARACALAWEAHCENGPRKSGELYFTHPLAVAKILIEWGFDAEVIAAALCHDVIEDGRIHGKRVTQEFIEKYLGRRVARLVQGVTELGKEPGFKDQEVSVAGIYRKLFSYGSMDPAILFIKLADRLHNMRTLEYMKPETQRLKANATLNFYARIADILGFWEIKRELEDYII